MTEIVYCGDTLCKLMYAMIRRQYLYGVSVFSCVLFMVAGCSEEVGNADQARQDHPVLSKTIEKPGPPSFANGSLGGTRVSTINDDPKTFNTMTARDGDSRAIVDSLFNEALADYDPYTKEFIPNIANFEIVVDEAQGTLRVIYTLRDDLYWTYSDSDKKITVSADDVVFWYDEVDGDQTLQQPGYASQFVQMPDGSERRITIEKLSTYSFAFDFPRIVANPILSSNMSFGPLFIYKTAKDEGGAAAMLDVLSVDTDVLQIPSLGPYHIVEYTPGVRVVMRRNPNYWKKDDAGTSLPYTEEVIVRIVPDQNTEYLVFRNGETDSYSARPEDLIPLLEIENRDFDIYDGGPALSSGFFTFNQNPNTVDPVKLAWFTNRKFRQAMSSALNRERISRDVYRGLARPAEYFFAVANPMFDPDIKLAYTYNLDRALSLLEEMGMEKGADGLLYDNDGNQVGFDIMHGVESDTATKIVAIFVEDLRSLGISVEQKPIDFQNLVGRLTNTYEWDAVSVSLGANYWPSSGSNVWQSSGNFHLWYPLQESPATPWEARLDELYNEGRFTIDRVKAKAIYDEYQRIVLEELPLFYTVYPNSFLAIRSRWQNVFFDALAAFESTRLYLE